MERVDSVSMATKLEMWKALKKKVLINDAEPNKIEIIESTTPAKKLNTTAIASKTEVKIKNRRRYMSSSKIEMYVSPIKDIKYNRSNSAENQDPNHSEGKTLTSSLKEFQNLWDKRKEKSHLLNKKSTTQDQSKKIFECSKSSDEHTALLERIKVLEDENKRLRSMYNESEIVRKEVTLRAKYAVEEFQAQSFHNDVLMQQITELNTASTYNKLQVHEDSSKCRKLQIEIRKLREKNKEYEDRSQTMMTEMTGRMTQLQEVAMERISVRKAGGANCVLYSTVFYCIVLCDIALAWYCIVLYCIV